MNVLVQNLVKKEVEAGTLEDDNGTGSDEIPAPVPAQKPKRVSKGELCAKVENLQARLKEALDKLEDEKEGRRADLVIDKEESIWIAKSNARSMLFAWKQKFQKSKKE